MMNTLQHMGWLFVISCCFYYKLPEGFQKCNRRQADFSECLTKAVENALRQLNTPLEEYGLYLDPLEIPPFSVAATKKTAKFYQEYKSYRMFGFSVVNCSKVEMNFVTNNLTIECNFPEITTLAEYHIDGELLGLIFNGTGAGSYTISMKKLFQVECTRIKDITNFAGNFRINLSFILGEYEKFGQIHYTVICHKFEIDPESIENINLGNIASGDRLQSNKINEAFNKNWKILLDELKPGYERAISNHIVTIFNIFLEKVPVSEIFEDY